MRQCGLIGERLGHSYSATIHAMLGGYDYKLYPMPPQDVKDFVLHGPCQGLNVTIPYKKTVLPLCDSLSPEARHIGSVNTLVRTADGLAGYNTDYTGFSQMARRAGIDFKGRKVAILGSGGTSMTARCVCLDAGAREVVTVSRGGPVTYAMEGAYKNADILINTTPVGMFPAGGGCPMELTGFSNLCGVLDVIYNPLRTRLVQQAMALGIPASGGLYMLVAQAVAANGLFLGRPQSAQACDKVYGQLLSGLENIVLIGMPGSGKTHVGGLVASRLGREVADSDEAVIKQAGMPIPQIFATQGEAAFRRLERAAIAALGEKTGLVIATGGGAVLDDANIAALRQNGRLYYLRRPLGALDTAGRPLSANPQALADMEKARRPLYMAACDAVVDNTRSPEDAAQSIGEEFLHEHPGA
nr:shikimate kinase [bacterium]